jgi:hypothetical protein
VLVVYFLFSFFLSLSPNKTLFAFIYVKGIGAVVGALSRNLAFLEDHEGSYLSIYDHPTAIVKVPTPLPSRLIKT